MRVRCIDDSAWNGSPGTLIKNNVYEVNKEYSDTYYLHGLPGGWRKERFIVVNDDEVYAEVTPRSIIRVAKILDEIKSDQEEERLRKILRPRIASHECPCGIARSQCSYHR